MALSWVRLDSSIAQNPKVLALVEDKKWQAIALYCFGLGYSGIHELAGFIPKSALRVMHADTRVAQQLVEAGFWIPAGEAGWDIKDWAEYQPSGPDAEARKKRAKDAAMVRWHGKQPKRKGGK